MNLQEDLREFIELLNSASVKYVIVGAYAVGFHGHPRTTGDIDIFVEPSVQNAAAVTSSLERFGFGSLGLRGEDFCQPDQVV